MPKKSHPELIRIGEIVRSARHDAGISQDDLADHAGIYRTYLSRIECGQANPTALVLIALAKALNITASDLLM